MYVIAIDNVIHNRYMNTLKSISRMVTELIDFQRKPHMQIVNESLEVNFGYIE